MSRSASRSDGSSGDVAEVVRRHGQQLWLRGFRRFTGESATVIAQLGNGTLTGFTIEIALLRPALLEGADYRESRDRDRTAPLISVADVMLEDAANAAALLRRELGEQEGWLAVDLPPGVDLDGDTAVAWARRLREATPGVRRLVRTSGASMPLVENLVAAGFGVYVHNLFSVDQVEGTLAAHQRGLRLARAAGIDLGDAAMVAGVDLVRVDVAVDELIRDAIARQPEERDLLESLIGRTAVAVARVAYAALQTAIEDRGWKELAAAGAVEPLLAWESTRTLSAARRDVEFMEELIGPGTASVVTRDALAAFLDHGRPSPRLGRHHEEAREILADLSNAGVELDSLARDLQFAATAADADRRAALGEAFAGVDGTEDRLTISAGPLADPFAAALVEAREQRLTERVWAREAALWSADAAAREHVRNRLGWLSLPETMGEQALPLAAIARGRSGGHDQRVVLLGMGGSSLGAEALKIAFEVRAIEIVDTTVPRGVAAIASRLDPARTLFVVSSKSGTTVETLALEQFFFEQLQSRLDNAAEHFVVVTDPGTPLHSLARERRFARVWLAPPDVGGRYSVLSVFGMLPAALMSIDTVKVLDRAQAMAIASGPEVPEPDNPAARLGIFLAAAAAAGRDKLTFLASPRMTGFADWAEQLVAESSGKGGLGIIPVSQEPPGEVAAYREDRLFVQLRLREEPGDAAAEGLAAELEATGHPVIRILLNDAADIGREFFRWELATAIACARLGVNAFDEPDVRGAKERARAALDRVDAAGEEPVVEVAREESLALIVPPGDTDLARAVRPDATAEDWMRAHLRRTRPGDYLAILAFLAPEVPTWHALQGLRALVRDRLGVATTSGWGPRFLHSTGQLHKGGPPTGVFLQLTADDASDLEVPGQRHSFAELARAQSTGDFEALAATGRRLLRVHLSGAPEKGLARLLELVRLALND